MTITGWFTVVGGALVLLAALGIIADIVDPEDEEEFFNK